MRPATPSLVVVLALTLLAGCGGGGGKPQQKEAAEQRERAPQPRQEQHTVVPRVETTPVSHSGDAADDAAIWVNPSDPARSTIIGTDKLGGIAVYDRAGT
jgi:3-phytase